MPDRYQIASLCPDPRAELPGWVRRQKGGKQHKQLGLVGRTCLRVLVPCVPRVLPSPIEPSWEINPGFYDPAPPCSAQDSPQPTPGPRTVAFLGLSCRKRHPHPHLAPTSHGLLSSPSSLSLASKVWAGSREGQGEGWGQAEGSYLQSLCPGDPCPGQQLQPLN